MAKSHKKTKRPPTSNQSQINIDDQPSKQNQPAPYTKVKNSSSKFSIFYYLLAITFCLLMFNSAINHLMGSYALSSALSQGYAYASYIDKNMTLLDMFFSGVFFCIVLSYVLVIWALADSCGHNSSSSGGSWGKNSIISCIFQCADFQITLEKLKSILPEIESFTLQNLIDLNDRLNDEEKSLIQMVNV